MKRCKEVFVGIDTAKSRNAVAVAEAGREGEVRYLGEFANTPDAVAKLMRKLADRYETLHFCYEAGPTGYDRVPLGGVRAWLVITLSGGAGRLVNLPRRAS